MIIETAHVGSSSAQIFTHITLYKMRIYNYYVQLYIIPLNPIKSPLNHHYTTIYNINVDHHGFLKPNSKSSILGCSSHKTSDESGYVSDSHSMMVPPHFRDVNVAN